MVIERRMLRGFPSDEARYQGDAVGVMDHLNVLSPLK